MLYTSKNLRVSYFYPISYILSYAKNVDRDNSRVYPRFYRLLSAQNRSPWKSSNYELGGISDLFLDAPVIRNGTEGGSSSIIRATKRKGGEACSPKTGVNGWQLTQCYLVVAECTGNPPLSLCWSGIHVPRDEVRYTSTAYHP